MIPSEIGRYEMCYLILFNYGPMAGLYFCTIPKWGLSYGLRLFALTVEWAHWDDSTALLIVI